MDKDTNTAAAVTRRTLFAGAGTAGALAAAAVALPLARPADTPAEARPAEPAGQGYRLSEHVRSYYRTTRV